MPRVQLYLWQQHDEDNVKHESRDETMRCRRVDSLRHPCRTPPAVARYNPHRNITAIKGTPERDTILPDNALPLGP